VCVDPRQLPGSWAGRAFDHELLAQLPPGVDPCGENGEFHTFAWDGPMFDRPVHVQVGALRAHDGLACAELTPAEA
jgi:diphthamide synthase (EF-2-diphthine--ammonia ligase)